MAILLPEGLPAAATLAAEGIEVAGPAAGAAGHRRLRIALLNLMPEKAATETQLARVLAAAAFEVELTLFVPDGYVPKTAPAEHMAAYYRTWSEIREQRFDGLIVTGAPVETLPFEQVSYWPELIQILDWSRSHARSSYLICWAAQAALYHFHGVPKYTLPEKLFGVFPHTLARPQSPLLRGFDDGGFRVPVSRHSEVRAEDLPAGAGLEVLAQSEEAGLCLIEDAAHGAIYMFNHFEYDAETLADEYRRDRAAGRPIAVPRHYFPADDPSRTPQNCWRPYAHLFFPNWLAELDRRARAGAAERKMPNWLLASPPAARAADFLVRADDNAETTTRVLRRLAMLGLAPEALRAHRQHGAELVLELRLAGTETGRAERIAQALLCLTEVHGVSFRGAGGRGGTLVERKVSGMIAATGLAPPGKYPTAARAQAGR